MVNDQKPIFLSPRLAAKRLRSMGEDRMQTGAQNISGRWWHADDTADLYLWVDEKHRPIRSQFSFFGQIVEWNALDGVRTGVVIEEESRGESSLSRQFVHFDSRPSETAVQQVLEFLNYAEVVPTEDRDLFKQLFSGLRNRTHAAMAQRIGAAPSKNSVWLGNLWQRVKNLTQRRPK